MTYNQQKNSKSNLWLETNIAYEGEGRAEFDNPKGTIEGFIKVHFDEVGNYSIEMNAEKCYSEQTLRFGWMGFFNADPPIEEQEGSFIFTDRLGSNPCKSLTVNTPDGIYSAQGNIFYNLNIDLIADKAKIQFNLAPSLFERKNAEPPKYWLFPIFNFVSEFSQRNLQLDCHPLRICPKIENPESTTGAAAIHDFFFSQTDKLIVFEFNKALGFIEPLPDFNERKKKLYSGQVQRIITAVMVGEVGSELIDIDQLRNWMPFGFLPLLSLTTGSEVGIPWIEFRDANGGLVRRIHDRFGLPQFSRGHTTLSEVNHRETGYLLTCAQSSSNYGKAPLGSAIFDLVQSSSHKLTVEDKLSKVCRALDYLCKHYNLDSQNLLLGLDSTHQNFVKTALSSVAKQIRLAANATSDPGQSKLLIKIADKTINASNVDRDFGLAVTDLLTHLGLHDADIIDAYYQKNPRTDGTKHWSGVLSNYRGIAVHKGDFGFQSGTYDARDVIRITYHLYDILVRIIFKMLGYDRTYQPIVVKTAVQKPVDWVNLEISAEELGY